MGDAQLELQIERLLVDRYPSSMTALEIMRALALKSATKKSINRVLYHRIATKGMASVKEGTPPCWTATLALRQKLGSDKQGAVDACRGQLGNGAGQPQQNWSGGTQMMSYQPSAMARNGMQSSALALSSPSQQPSMQVMQTAVGVVQPCNHVHVVPGVLAYSTGGTCYACQAEQASSQPPNPQPQGQSLAQSTTQGAAYSSQAVMSHEMGNQHLHQHGHSHQYHNTRQSEYGGQQVAMSTNHIQQGGAVDPSQLSRGGNPHPSVQHSPPVVHGGAGHQHQQHSGSINHGMACYMSNEANSSYHMAQPGATGYHQMGGIPGGATYQQQPQGYLFPGGADYGVQMGGGGGGGAPAHGNRTSLSPTQTPGCQYQYQNATHGVGSVLRNDAGVCAQGSGSGNLTGKLGQTLTAAGIVYGHQEQGKVGEGTNVGSVGQENESDLNRGGYNGGV
ncbi:hypothetical protein BSKO_12130 [Bryopsis sp. KO-2023]|nr:hypothetical protein BSKO_12130 [Bryopsis sp. KO-2023]